MGSLASLVQTARDGLAQESIPIRITDPGLAVDDMNRALQQVGGSYLLCQLSRDGTAVTVTPQDGLTPQQALERLAELAALLEPHFHGVEFRRVGRSSLLVWGIR